MMRWTLRASQHHHCADADQWADQVGSVHFRVLFGVGMLFSVNLQHLPPSQRPSTPVSWNVHRVPSSLFAQKAFCASPHPTRCMTRSASTNNAEPMSCLTAASFCISRASSRARPRAGDQETRSRSSCVSSPPEHRGRAGSRPLPRLHGERWRPELGAQPGLPCPTHGRRLDRSIQDRAKTPIPTQPRNEVRTGCDTA